MNNRFVKGVLKGIDLIQLNLCNQLDGNGKVIIKWNYLKKNLIEVTFGVKYDLKSTIPVLKAIFSYDNNYKWRVNVELINLYYLDLNLSQLHVELKQVRYTKKNKYYPYR